MKTCPVCGDLLPLFQCDLYNFTEACEDCLAQLQYEFDKSEHDKPFYEDEAASNSDKYKNDSELLHLEDILSNNSNHSNN